MRTTAGLGMPWAVARAGLVVALLAIILTLLGAAVPAAGEPEARAAEAAGEPEARAAEAAGETDAPAPEAAGGDGRSARVGLGPFGEVELAGQPLLAATALIALVDGFNPCSLWVLTVLLAMILHTRSRARVAAVGLTFLLVTATVYGVFIAGLFAAFAVAGFADPVRFAVAALALAFAAVNIKDYVAFKQGVSLTIPDRFKPRIYRGGRSVREDKPLPIVLAITVALAAGVALIELPCTAGLPLVWTGLVSDAGVDGAGFVGLLAVYLVVYLGIEIVLLLAALVTLASVRLDEARGRVLKLIGGAVMAAIAVVLIVDPSVMESFAGSLGVIGAALGVAAVVALVFPPGGRVPSREGDHGGASSTPEQRDGPPSAQGDDERDPQARDRRR
ncbi:MAG: thioredoxin [Actinomycetota bacterium]